MNKIPIVHIVGKKRSGKTDLMVGLIGSLSARGYKVAAVRHSSHEHAVDKEGTDTSRYKQAGARGTALVTASETNLFISTKDWDEKVSVLEDAFCGADLVLMEGGIKNGEYKIEVAKKGENLLCREDEGLMAVVGGSSLCEDVTCFSTGDIAGISDLIEGSFLVPIISVAVMAGGKSKRLGQNKALIQINGITVVESVLNMVSPYVQKVMIITNTPEEYNFLDIETSKDVRPGFGPLSGIHSALSLASSEYVLVVSCDIPLVGSKQIEQLVSSCRGHDITIFKHKNFEPLCAVYRRSCIDALNELIDYNECRIIDLFPTLDVKVLRVDDAEIFRSINTKEDYDHIVDKLSK
jgi:molybdopterin-guanine dinucleotide biosynthesis protein A